MQRTTLTRNPARCALFLVVLSLVYFSFSTTVYAQAIGSLKTVKSEYDDTLLEIARKYDLGFIEMRAANPDIDPWLPGEGSNILLPLWNLLPDAKHEGIVINLAELRMYIYEKDKDIRTFPIGIGREGFETPLGETYVSWKRPNPTWTPTPDMRKANPDLPKVVEPGPGNPLGTHAVYLGWPNYLIHGTSKPWGIGRRVSSGCIRMYPEDIKQVFAIAQNKMPVTVVNQPLKMAWVDGVFYLEAHPDITEMDAFMEAGYLPSYDIEAGKLSDIRKAMGKWAYDIDWALVRDVIRERKGYPVKIFERPQYEDKELR